MDSCFIAKNIDSPGENLGRLTSLGKRWFNTFNKGENPECPVTGSKLLMSLDQALEAQLRKKASEKQKLLGVSCLLCIIFKQVRKNNHPQTLIKSSPWGYWFTDWQPHAYCPLHMPLCTTSRFHFSISVQDDDITLYNPCSNILPILCEYTLTSTINSMFHAFIVCILVMGMGLL